MDGSEKNYCDIRGVSPSTYKTVIKNIADIAQLGDKVKIAVRLNASKKNIEDLKVLCDILLSQYNLKNKILIYLAEIKDYTKCFEKDCSVFRIGEYEMIKNEFYKYLQEKYGVYNENLIVKKNPSSTYCRLVCSANVAIGPDGELYKCEQLIGNAEHIVGNIIDGYYYNEAYDNFCKVEHFDKCKTCKVFPLCLSGCKSCENTFGEGAVDCNGLALSLKTVLKKYYQKEA